MNEYLLSKIDRQIDRLDDKVSSQSTTNFIWLMILSNMMILVFFACLSLKRDIHDISKKYELKACTYPTIEKMKNFESDKGRKNLS